jgi:hypothetical protein
MIFNPKQGMIAKINSMVFDLTKWFYARSLNRELIRGAILNQRYGLFYK